MRYFPFLPFFTQISRSLTSSYIDSCGIYFIEITLKGCRGVSFEFQRNIYWLIYVISLVKARFEACVEALIIFRVFNNQKTELKQVTSEYMFLSSGTRPKIVMWPWFQKFSNFWGDFEKSNFKPRNIPEQRCPKFIRVLSVHLWPSEMIPLVEQRLQL